MLSVNLIRNALPRCVAPLGCLASRKKHTLPDLPYDYNALEPYISADIMKVHHGKHHATYVNNVNVFQDKLAEAQKTDDLTAIVSISPMLRFNAGGHINHSIFWQNLSPNGGGEPTGDLLEAIKRDFGSFEAMRTNLNAMTTAVQGSGWGWLGFNKTTGKLQLTTTANQDLLQPTTGLTPLFCIDVWEHAYYLQYKNVRADFVNAIWNIVNWNDISERFANARSG